MARNLQINKDPNAPQPFEVMEKAIVEIAEGARKMLAAKLNRRALLVLMQDACGGRGSISKETIARVLDEAAKLDKTYLKLALLGIVAAGLSACAAHAPAKQLRQACKDTPGAIAADQQGQVGFFECFREDGVMTFESHRLPPPPPAKPAPKAKK